MKQRGIILLAHGSRDPLWRLPMETVAQLITERDPQLLVSCAYLELTQPDLESAVIVMASKGLQSVTIVPMFLGLGKHAKEDIPLLMTVLQQQHPGLDFTLQATVGENPRVLSVLAEVAAA